jgi:hypothetical protein
VAIDDIVCLLAGCSLAAFDGSPLEDFLQKIIQSVYIWFQTTKRGITDYLGTNTSRSSLRCVAKCFKQAPIATKSSGLRDPRNGGSSI